MQDAVAHWTEVLTGLDHDRVAKAADRISDWQIPHVCDELLRPDVDSAAAATLLVEAVDLLVERGADADLVFKKLRDDRQVWGAWAELRSASIFLQAGDPGVRITLEPDQQRGRPGPDFRFELTDGSSQLVEFKAVGLSDREADFCSRVTPSLQRLMPAAGLVTFHCQLDVPGIRLDRQGRRELQRDAAARIRNIPRYPQGLRGATAVGHRADAEYIHRLRAYLGRGHNRGGELRGGNGVHASEARHGAGREGRWLADPGLVVDADRAVVAGSADTPAGLSSPASS